MNRDDKALQQLNEDEEAEYEREELVQQDELRAMLRNALNADDLLDDDDDDEEENLPQSNSSMFSQDNSIIDDGSELAWQLSVAPQPAVPTLQQQTSTPRSVDNSLPALQTPSTVLHSLYAAKTVFHQPDNYKHAFCTDELSLSLDGFNGFEGNEYVMQNAQRWPEGQDDVQHTVGQDNVQYYYADDCDVNGQMACHDGAQLGAVHQYSVEGQYETDQFGMKPNLENCELPYDQTGQLTYLATSETFAQSYTGANINPNLETNGALDGNIMIATWPRQSETTLKQVKSVGKLQQPQSREVMSRSPTKATNRESESAGGDSYQYRVSYKPPATVNNDKRIDVVNLHIANTESTSERLQQEFLHSDGQSMWSDRETQLRVLLEAKTHRIEELSSSLNELQDSSEREMRILNHQLIMMKDERDGLAQTVRQSELLIQEKQVTENQLHGQVAVLKAEISTLLQTKDDMVKKISTMESMVDSLNSQLSELGSSDALARARHQHEAIVSGLRQKMDAETMSSNKKIDTMNQQLINKEDQIIELRKQVSDLEKTKKSMLQEHAEEINRLHRTLKESQQECRDLLEAQSSQEFSRMKVKLQNTLASKALTDDLNDTLQTEVQELREQLQMFEMVSKYSGTVTTALQASMPSEATLDDSYAQLAIKKPGQATLQSTVSDRSLDSGVLSADDAVHGLKTELERCLRKCREKSQLVTKLQAELKTCQSSVEESNTKLEATELELAETKALVKQLESSSSNKAQKNYDSIVRENDGMQLELEELRRRLAEVADSESHVTELNIELSQQITQLINDRTANNNVDEQSCIREEQLQHACDQFEQQVVQLSEQVVQLQQELLSTKELYVDVCKLKDTLENEVQYLKKEIIHQQQLAEQSSHDHIDREITAKVSQLTNEHDKKMTAVEKYYLEKQASAEQENKSLLDTIQTLKRQISDMESQHEMVLSDLEKEFVSKLSELETHYQLQLDDRNKLSEENLLEVQRQHSTVVSDLQELYRRTATELDNVKIENDTTCQSLRSEIATLQIELQNLLKQHNQLRTSLKMESELQVSNLLLEKNSLEERIKEFEKGMEKCEMEKREMSNNNRKLVEELEQRINDLSGKISEADEKTNVLVSQTQESLEREHAIVVAALQEKLTTKNMHNVIEDDGSKIDKMKLMAEELRSQYVAAMEQMKAAVLAHSIETAQCCAEQYQQKLVKDRQTTARSLRSYYLRCLAKLLDADFDHLYKSEFLKRMERLLDNLPEKDVNTASQCPTPSISMSSVSSPRELTSAETTPRPVPTRTLSMKHPDVPSLLLSDSSTTESCDSTPRGSTAVSGASLPSGKSRTSADDSVQRMNTSSHLTMTNTSSNKSSNKSCVTVTDLRNTSIVERSARPASRSEYTVTTGSQEAARGARTFCEVDNVVPRPGSAPMWAPTQSGRSTVPSSPHNDGCTWVTNRT